HLLGCFKMAIIGRGDTCKIDPRREKRRRGVFAGVALECGNPAPGLLAILFRPRSCAGSDCYQRHVYLAKTSVKQPFGMDPLEEWTVGFIKNHPHADHTGPETVARVVVA